MCIRDRLHPDPHLTVLCGPNGQGKTNLLEAIWLLTGGKSFRGSKDAELIRRGCDFSVIEGAFETQMFEMFYSGKNKVSDSRRSLGLGLALCRSIVNAHGGEIALYDYDPQGCCFRINLPLSEVNLNE